MQAVKKCKQL